MDITKKLFEFKDIKYKSFQEKLIPTVLCDKVIGIRTPTLRKFAKELYSKNEYADFLNILPHRYYEENNLHAFLIENIKDFDIALEETRKFLPYIDNWATCDSFLPPVFKKNTDKLFTDILKWIKSDKTYTVRFGIGLLLKLYADENFDAKFLKLVSSVKSDEYYIKMMVAWYFATLLAKQYDKTIPYIKNHTLDRWTHNKAIQKALESYRIDLKTKEYLKTLKITQKKQP
ncbi:MAG: DNA alkylation repair protein [Clostridia bacterium]|nr:DNA alkylation repair protein [Clostridia bacterium]